MELSVLVTQMLVLFILIICGYISGKSHLLKQEDIPLLSKITLNIGIPGVVLSSVSDGCELTVSEFFACLAGFFAFNILCALLAKTAVKVLRIRIDRKLYEFMYTFSNVGFMGLPVVHAVLGEEAMIYAVIFLLPNNLMLFSYGEQLMRDAGGFSLKRFFSPPIAASLLAVVICIFDIRFPYVIAKSISCMGSITTPLAMLIIGISLNGVSFGKMMKNKELLLFLAVKMLLFPLVGWAILYALHVPALIRDILILMTAMPVPSNTVIYAGMYKKNVLLASQASVLTNFVCVITIPIVFSILSIFS